MAQYMNIMTEYYDSVCKYTVHYLFLTFSMIIDSNLTVSSANFLIPSDNFSVAIASSRNKE